MHPLFTLCTVALIARLDDDQLHWASLRCLEDGDQERFRRRWIRYRQEGHVSWKVLDIVFAAASVCVEVSSQTVRSKVYSHWETAKIVPLFGGF